MAEETPAPERTPAMADPTFANEHVVSNPKPDETLAIPSYEAVIESNAHGSTTESTCNKVETSDLTSDGNGDREKSLEFASELMEKGSLAVKDRDFNEATDCFSRALEIRVAHYGELALECVDAYYKYGCTLLYKAQEEADPLATVPKKDGESQQDVGSGKSAANCETKIPSVSCVAEQDGNTNHQERTADDGSHEKDQEDRDEESEDEDVAEADEDESDLDLAWKMLDVARVIIEKNSCETMEKVDILSALAEVALEREDVETSLSDYLKALSILERLVEPDSRNLAELNFRICLCLEIGSKAQEAIPYCQKALSICKSQVERLIVEVKGSYRSATTSAGSELCEAVQHSSSGSNSINSVSNEEADIETLNGLSSELEKKLEDLQHAASNPTPFLSEILAIMSAKATGNEKNSSAGMSSSQMRTAINNGDFDSPTVSAAHTNGSAGVTHLGVIGRGVKRTLTNSGTTQSGPVKRPASSSSPCKGEDNTS